MPSNVRQLLENGTPIYPITERSLVIGLQDAPFEYYVLAWDGASTPVVSKIPAGVVVTYNNTNYTGTLAASATTAPYLYLVASTTQAGEYDRYIVTNNGNNTFSWTPVGSTAPVTPVIVDNLTTNDATKALSAKQGKVLKDELSQFEAKVDDILGASETHTDEWQNKHQYSMSDGSDLGTADAYISTKFAKPLNATHIDVVFPASNNSFGVILYNTNDEFIRSYAASTNVSIDLADNVGYIVVQAYKTWSCTWTISSKGRLTAVEENMLTDAPSNGSTFARKDGEWVAISSGAKQESHTDEWQGKHHYSMSDGSDLGTEDSYISTKVEIPTWATKISATFPSDHNSFGVILYDENDAFIASYPAKTPQVEISFNGTAKYVAIQAYKTWACTWIFSCGASGIEGMEERLEDLEAEVGNVVYHTIVATRNSADYNSIRDIINGISDASAKNQYIIKVPKGRWFECDIQGKEFVTLIGEDREQTILYCDGTSTNLTPSGYAYIADSNKPLNTIDYNFKHCIFLKHNFVVKNLRIEVNDCKYTAHLDNSGFSKARFENCHFVAIGDNINKVVGMGAYAGQQMEFYGCIFERKNTTIADIFNYGLFVHNYANQSEPSLVAVDKCLFKNCNFWLLWEQDSGQEDCYYMTDCYADRLKSVEWSANSVDDGYCIKLNTLGTNVTVVSIRESEGVPLRPNALDYMISNFDLIAE